ncbi:GNAT family N-acetyltransferase [Oscillochloris sp. ZM17-4]|uniref:GNAT family N-acetyltransferase n=1 Tax=Oscillochloris sp. ZM17-4 TaxID=2866714 RepID=UPI001C72C4A0|nr:GNAT family N-acetyltransferase [Oscillochloris sp. ZM17-4]MBX0327032.1 GNAT family N-acetyltransferase [Oscillochloris sp. ZM17-4]
MSDLSDTRPAIRWPQSGEDVERLAAFHGTIHGPGLVDMSLALMREHPHAARPENWLFVEDAGSGQIDAGLCLIPWMIRYGDVTLRAGEMGIVGTAEGQRGRGLIRALNAQFDALLRADGYDISIIQGIPYFYRQFGYEYALPLESWCRVELHSIPPAEGETYHMRVAVAADIPALMRLYDEAGAQLDVSALRDEATWRFLLGPGAQIETAGECWMLEGPGGAPAGYLRVMAAGFGDGLICGEASLMRADAALAALRWLTRLAGERGKPYLRLNLPQGHILNQLATRHGASPWRAYAWQIRLIDPPALLRRLAPVFEGRLAGGPFAGLTRDLAIDMYRSALTLRFAGGRLASVETEAPGGPHDLRVPPQLLAPLLFGWRSLDELSYAYPDLYASDEARLLVEALFPPTEAFLYGIY